MTQAVYYSICPLKPNHTIHVTEWADDAGEPLVLVRLTDEDGIHWLGSETSPDISGSAGIKTDKGDRFFMVNKTTVLSYERKTWFSLSERDPASVSDELRDQLLADPEQ